GQASEYYNGDFHVLIPERAASHPIWHIVDNPARNRDILARMPAFHGTNLIDRLKPAATVLGVTDRPLTKAKAMPVFACQPFGRGRTFAMSTDSTMAWGTDFESRWGEG